jgi:hypothetical protein
MRLYVVGKLDAMWALQILRARRMNTEHQDHGRFLQTLESDVVARANLHFYVSTSSANQEFIVARQV